MKVFIKKRNIRLKKKAKIRNKITGSADRPRLSIYRSLNHIYIQAIDDASGRTLASSSSLDKKISDVKITDKPTTVGFTIGEKLLSMGVEKAVFDRNGFLYHGRIKLLAEGVRAAGLKF